MIRKETKSKKTTQKVTRKIKIFDGRMKCLNKNKALEKKFANSKRQILGNKHTGVSIPVFPGGPNSGIDLKTIAS